jgi:hypothetical protein
MRPTQMAPITVPARIPIPKSPTKKRFTNTGEDVTVNAAGVLHATLCTECAMKVGHTLLV